MLDFWKRLQRSEQSRNNVPNRSTFSYLQFSELFHPSSVTRALGSLDPVDYHLSKRRGPKGERSNFTNAKVSNLRALDKENAIRMRFQGRPSRMPIKVVLQFAVRLLAE